MKETLFPVFVKQKFGGVTLAISKKLEKDQDSYLFKSMLRREYSIDGTWKTLQETNSRIMADVVAFDSPLPLKNRESFGSATGDIVKIGMEMKLNETQLKAVDTMIRLGGNEAEITRRIFNDVGSCIRGVMEKTEYAFQLGLSTGATEIQDDTNTGKSIRVDFGYLPENKFTASAAWTNPATAPTVSDIKRVLESANEGSNIRYIMTDLKTFNIILNSAEGKQLYATYVGNFGTNLQTPSRERFLEAVQSELGVEFIITNRKFEMQKNGRTTKNLTAWAEGTLIFLQDLVVGSHVWSTLAEKTHPVAGVQYQDVDEYILACKFSVNDPTVAEVSRAQALALPIISDVANIYQLNSKQVGG